MNVFLRARHWQLFGLMIGLPLICDMLLFKDIPLGYALKHQNSFRYFFVLTALYTAISFAWTWAIAVNLQHKIPQHIKMKTKRFKIFFFVPIAYISCMMLFLLLAKLYQLSDITQYETPFLVGFITFVSFHLLSTFCIFYCMYFTAKTIKTAQLQREVTFSEFTGEFFMIWFYFIGIWIIQPRVNKLMAQSADILNS